MTDQRNCSSFSNSEENNHTIQLENTDILDMDGILQFYPNELSKQMQVRLQKEWERAEQYKEIHKISNGMGSDQ